ncbi:IS1182 family transposase [Burkholderia ubonensis]|uniref:IS1182 family transposase n=1 Tax=Burkholderia ubonensis TaxID=101571 RepID=A0AB74CX51_9BURK|nr:IS1182 family transposase [Burkholderia ubonensis]PAJ77676.1 IS5/IS1182 family transposase [Burkholderia ubonensis]PAJ83995.1 IS5/IS1182 family transposase [Burkholderia ubonensis]PAJ98128.1 IS5/IS1182 family transposase [Burkholderia ubonensis]PAK04108.1 IS5/IS1182 family transposase [Burkholderia ubonensis]PAK13492.1 IS5/IS1182 family transposase [Burkholderia ubonensis]
MKRFVEGGDRKQVTLLPECLDDFVAEDNPVRIIDAFVEGLELGTLGFDGVRPSTTGRPSYHPAVLLKIYIYGYLNRVQSSRRLERECQRNVELMWLTGRLAPDFKTIADFRRDNGAGIRNVCRQFVILCRDLKLFSRALVAIDGSKFKASNTRDRNFTAGKIDKRQQQIEESIQRYLLALETADRTQPVELEAKTERLQEKIAQLRKQMSRLDQIKEQLKTQPDGQLSLTDPDARSMATSGKGSGMVEYNVQVAVDAKHHLVVAHEVTNAGHDRAQLSPMAQAARDAMDKPRLKAIADRGYYSGPQIKKCADVGIAVILPKPTTSGAKAHGRFDRADFIYIARDDEYQCPAGERAIYRFTREEHGLQLRRYWSSACPRCALKSRCTPSDYRRISRWEHEETLEAVQRRLDKMPDAMTVRRRTVEHVFGTFKHWMGYTHFLTRTLKNVGTEMSLHVLAYNLRRVLAILGFAKTMKAIRVASA